MCIEVSYHIYIFLFIDLSTRMKAFVLIRSILKSSIPRQPQKNAPPIGLDLPNSQARNFSTI